MKKKKLGSSHVKSQVSELTGISGSMSNPAMTYPPFQNAPKMGPSMHQMMRINCSSGYQVINPTWANVEHSHLTVETSKRLNR